MNFPDRIFYDIRFKKIFVAFQVVSPLLVIWYHVLVQLSVVRDLSILLGILDRVIENKKIVDRRFSRKKTRLFSFQSSSGVGRFALVPLSSLYQYSITSI